MGARPLSGFLIFVLGSVIGCTGTTVAMRRAFLLSLIPASRSSPLGEMVNQYQFRYQDLLREVTKEVFSEANSDVILEAFHTVKQSSLTPTPREFINFVEQFSALGRRVRDGITQRQAKDRLLDVSATMKVNGLLKEIIKEETKVGLELNYLEIIVFVMNLLMSRHKWAIKKRHIMRRQGQAIPEAWQPKPQVPPQRTGNKYGSGRVRGMERVEDMDKAENPEGHEDQEQADPELSIAEIQGICEAGVLAMSGRAGAGASSIPKCPACGRGRHSREDCWVLHSHKAPEWLQDKLKSKKNWEGRPREAPCARRWQDKRTTQRWEVSALQGLREHAASAGGVLGAPSGVAGERQG